MCERVEDEDGSGWTGRVIGKRCMWVVGLDESSHTTLLDRIGPGCPGGGRHRDWCACTTGLGIVIVDGLDLNIAVEGKIPGP
jgi:hypothetical protein